MVDALGGITVNNPQEFVSLHTNDLYPKGEIEMDGEIRPIVLINVYPLGLGSFCSLFLLAFARQNVITTKNKIIPAIINLINLIPSIRFY